MMFIQHLVNPKFSYFGVFTIAVGAQLFENGEILFALAVLLFGVLSEELILYRFRTKND